MKPSERIEQIYLDILNSPEGVKDQSVNRHFAIVKYLDEEYEKKQKELDNF